MEENVIERCQTCGYFHLHYIWRDGKYIAIHFGHCVHPPRVRNCRPDMAACPKWILQTEKYKRLYCPDQ